MGQSVFVGIMVLSIGILNLASVFIIKGYWSFTIWAISFGICYALPVSSQYSGTFLTPDLIRSYKIICVSLKLSNG